MKQDGDCGQSRTFPSRIQHYPPHHNGFTTPTIATSAANSRNTAVPEHATFQWGHALGWPQKFLESDPDPWVAKLQFLACHGLHSTDVGLDECEALEGERRVRVAGLLRDHAIDLTVIPPLDYFAKSPTQLRTEVDRWLTVLEAQSHSLPIGLVNICAGAVHRFLAQPSLAEQLDRLCAVLTPLARGCHNLGLRVGIENHGDYYVSDLVALCQRTPHLGIFFDTGNCHLIGEKPLAAAREAAPYLVGGHFKDQRVQPRPTNSPLCFEVGNAMPGEGDVPLRQIYQVLREHAPREQPLVMETECFPRHWNDPLPEFERALAFIRSLAD